VRKHSTVHLSLGIRVINEQALRAITNES